MDSAYILSSCESISRIFLYSNSPHVLLANSGTSMIQSLNLTTMVANIYQSNFKFNNPISVCANSMNEIYVYDATYQAIFMFNPSFLLLKSIPHSERAEFMELDASEQNMLYTSNWLNDKVILYNTENGQRLTEISVVSPWNIKIKNENLYIVSKTIVEYEGGSAKRFKSFVQGDNCILIINKRTFLMINIVKLNNWLSPVGIHVDEFLNVWSAAFKLDYNSSQSECEHLWKFDQNGRLIGEESLSSITWFHDFRMVGNMLYISGGDQKWIKNVNLLRNSQALPNNVA